MGSSPSRGHDARDALASFLGRCCTDATFCNDLFIDHRIETSCQTSEEQRDAVLCHVLNGLCILKPGVASCKSFGRGHMSTMHLSYEICTLLLSAYKLKRLSLNKFRPCCAAVGLRADGTTRGHGLSLKLQQRLTCWGPLWDCKSTLDMISRFDSFRGSGTLLELASLHNVCLDVNASENDGLRDAIVRHLVSGQCRGSNAPLCMSLCSELLLSMCLRELCSVSSASRTSRATGDLTEDTTMSRFSSSGFSTSKSLGKRLSWE